MIFTDNKESNRLIVEESFADYCIMYGMVASDVVCHGLVRRSRNI